jgi:hypothetical protein
MGVVAAARFLGGQPLRYPDPNWGPGVLVLTVRNWAAKFLDRKSEME